MAKADIIRDFQEADIDKVWQELKILFGFDLKTEGARFNLNKSFIEDFVNELLLNDEYQKYFRTEFLKFSIKNSRNHDKVQ